MNNFKVILFSIFLVIFIGININRPVRWFFGLEMSEIKHVKFENLSPAIETYKEFIGLYKIFPFIWNMPVTFDTRYGDDFNANAIAGMMLGYFLGIFSYIFTFSLYFYYFPRLVYNTIWHKL